MTVSEDLADYLKKAREMVDALEPWQRSREARVSDPDDSRELTAQTSKSATLSSRGLQV
jgi:hypothetical protein